MSVESITSSVPLQSSLIPSDQLVPDSGICVVQNEVASDCDKLQQDKSLKHPITQHLKSVIETIKAEHAKTNDNPNFIDEFNVQYKRLSRIIECLESKEIDSRIKILALQKVITISSPHTGKSQLQLLPTLATLVMAQSDLVNDLNAAQETLLDHHVEHFLQKKKIKKTHWNHAREQLYDAMRLSIFIPASNQPFQRIFSYEDVAMFVQDMSGKITMEAIVIQLSYQLSKVMWLELLTYTQSTPQVLHTL